MFCNLKREFEELGRVYPVGGVTCIFYILQWTIGPERCSEPPHLMFSCNLSEITNSEIKFH